MKSNTSVSKIMTASLITILAKLGGIFKVSFIFGSFAAFFSISSMLVPLTGAFGGILASTVLFGGGIAFRLLFGSFLSFKILAYYIPGYLASAYWATQSAWLSVMVPLVCMILFIAHPVGYQAAPYAAYWLIPVVIACLPQLKKINRFVSLNRLGTNGEKNGSENSPFVVSSERASRPEYRTTSPYKNIFLTSLSSTFIAHAVGSVIWIYATPITPEFWYALIPMVAVERLVMASGMTLAYHLFAKLFFLRFAAFQNYVARWIRA